MTEQNLKKLVSPKDHAILDATATASWVPQKPQELLLPYISQDTETPKDNSIDARRAKAKTIYDNYGKIIEQCEQLREQISDRCKAVEVTLDPSTHLRVIESVRRVFGTDGTKITFQMYQRCIEELAKESTNEIPQPGGKTV